MADKTIKVKVEVEADVQPTIAELKKLKLQLKETSDPVEFKKLQQSINDMEDSIKSARTGADNFAEVLGTLPGPIGNIGNAVGGTLQSLKQFSALKFGDIKSSFVELGKDVLDAGSGILKLTGITKLYTITTVAMSKALRFVGIEATTASFGVKAFSAALVATGIGAIVVGLGMLISAFMNVGDEADTTAGKIARLNAELSNTERVSKLRNAEEIARAKKLGATETELFQIKQRQKQEELDLARQTYKQADVQITSALVLYGKDSKGYQDAQKLKSEAAIKIDQLKSELLVSGYDEEDRLRKESLAKDAKAAQQGAQAIAKRQQEKDKEAADLKKTLDEITKNEKEAALSLLDVREQEKRKVIDNYNAQINLAAANGKDTFILEEAKLKALRELRDKFQKEDDDKQKEIDEKQKEKDKKKTEDDIAARVQEYENQISDLDAKNALIDNDFQEDLARLETKKELLAKEKADELSNTDLTLKERNEIIGRYAEKERDIEKSITDTKKAELQARTSMQMQYADYLQQFGNLLGQVAGENKSLAIAAIIIEQGAALAKVLIQASAANMAATAMAVSDPLNLVPGGSIIVAAKLARAKLMTNIQAGLSAAGIVAGAVKGISAINSAKVPGSSGAGGSAAAAGGAPPAYGGASVGMGTPQIQATNATNPSTQIAQTLGTAQAPIKAYIVSGEVSSQQALDRRTSRAATFA